MGEMADLIFDDMLLHPNVVCPDHQIEYTDDEWGCPMCENGDPPLPTFQEILDKLRENFKARRGMK